MARKQNYRLIVEVHDADEYLGGLKQLGDDGPTPGTIVIVELDSNNYNDILYIPNKRALDFWSRSHAEGSATRIRQLWEERFSEKARISKQEIREFMQSGMDFVITD